MLANAYIPQCTPGAQSLRRPLLVWGATLGLASIFVGLALIAPLALADGHDYWGQAIYKVFNPVCHQIPERSFYLAGYPLAVCARCLGLYAGIAAGIALFPLARSLRRIETPARVWLLLAAVPTVVDLSLGLTGIWENTHLSRFVTGALLGGVAAFFIVPGLLDLSRINWRRFFGWDATGQPYQLTAVVPEQNAPGDSKLPSSRS